MPGPDLLREALLWSQQRTVTKTATVSLAGNRHDTDPALIGRKVDLVFDPFDLTAVEIRWSGQSFGAAANVVGAHAHPKAASHLERHDDMPATTGIDYLALSRRAPPGHPTQHQLRRPHRPRRRQRHDHAAGRAAAQAAAAVHRRRQRRRQAGGRAGRGAARRRLADAFRGVPAVALDRLRADLDEVADPSMADPWTARG